MSTVEIPFSTDTVASDDDLLPGSPNDLPNSAKKHPCKKGHSNSLLGISLVFLSSLLFTTVGLMVKLLTGISAIEAAQAQTTLQFVIAVPFVLYFVEGSPLGPGDQLPWLLARGFFGVSAASCSYYAFKRMPIGDATVLIFTSPVFTGIISRLLLKEPWGLWEAGASLLSITGVVFIARPSFLFGGIARNHAVLQQNSSQSSSFHTERHSGKANLVAVGMALAAAVSMACALVAARKAGQKVHFLILTMYYGGVGVVLTLIVSIATREFVLPPISTVQEGVCLLIIGVFAFTAQVVLNKGLTLEQAGIGALVRNMDVVFAFIFQVTVFNDLVTRWSALGTVFILSATLTMAWKRYREQLRTEEK